MLTRIYFIFCLLFVVMPSEAQTISDISSVEDVPHELSYWVETTAVELTTVNPEEPMNDLSSLSSVIGDTRIVSLGEATHATRENFLMKHRLLRYLVEEEGFRVFLLEVNLPETLDINHYVLTGEGNPEELLEGIYYWVWNTREILDMINWIREYNIGHADDPVYFMGFDIQFPRAAAQDILDYVAVNIPESLNTYESVFDCIGASTPGVRGNPTSNCKNQIELLKEEFLIQTTGLEQTIEGQVILHSFDFIISSISYDINDMMSDNIRDRLMSEEVIWYYETLFPDKKIVLWAHNNHVREDLFFLSQPMGWWLNQRLQEDYLSIGFAIGTGSFYAVTLTETHQAQGIRLQRLLPLRENSHEFIFQSTGIPIFMLDLRNFPDEGIVYQWLTEHYYMRSIGVAYRPESNPEYFTIPTQLSVAYDAIIYIEQTTASTLLRNYQ